MGKQNRRFQCRPLKVSLTLLIVQLIVACNLATKPTEIVLEPSEIPLLPGITSTIASELNPSYTPANTLTPTITLTQYPTSTENPTFTSIPSNTPTPVCFHLLNPPDGSKLPEMGRVKFEWEPHPGVQKYLLEITEPNGRIQAFEVYTNYATRYMNTLPLEGVYTWEVAAYNASGGVTCIVGPFHFSKTKFVPSPTPAKQENSRPNNRKVKPGGGG